MMKRGGALIALLGLLLFWPQLSRSQSPGIIVEDAEVVLGLEMAVNQDLLEKASEVGPRFIVEQGEATRRLTLPDIPVVLQSWLNQVGARPLLVAAEASRAERLQYPAIPQDDLPPNLHFTHIYFDNVRLGSGEPLCVK
jgi:hypothetical protein